MTVMKRQIPCRSVPVDHISFGRQQLHMPIFFATAAHERPQPSHAHELFDHQQPRVVQLCVFGSDCYELLPTHQKVPGQQARKRLIYCGESTERHLSKTPRASASTRSSHMTPGAISSAKVCFINCPCKPTIIRACHSRSKLCAMCFHRMYSLPHKCLRVGGVAVKLV